MEGNLLRPLDVLLTLHFEVFTLTELKIYLAAEMGGGIMVKVSVLK